MIDTDGLAFKLLVGVVLMTGNWLYAMYCLWKTELRVLELEERLARLYPSTFTLKE